MTKLTLSMEPQLVAEAKRYAGARGVSVSGLVADFLSALTAPEATPDAPVLARLRGSLAGDEPDHAAWLEEKHLG